MFTNAGVTTQLKYCGALDVHPNFTVSFTVPLSTNPTTMFPPGVVVTLPVDVPVVVPNVKFAPLLNVAVTLSAPLIVTVHVPVPLHCEFPLHPAKLDPDPAVAVNTTCEFALKFATHPSGHVIPVGVLTTVPFPVPASVTVSANVLALNVAVTLSGPLIVTEHVFPLHSCPGHPPNVLPLPAVAVNVTVVPAAKFATHTELVPFVQSIPDGLLTTVPVPFPANVTVNAYVELLLNVAVTLSAALIVTVHVPVPLH
jgi:hypothetical protein